MKLYYTPGACSLAAHIILNETGLSHTLERVDLKTRTTASGADYLKINPRGAVPALEIAPGEVLTQNVAVLTYIGQQAGNVAMHPAPDSVAFFRLLEAIGFCEDVHGAFGALFAPGLPDVTRDHLLNTLIPRRLGQVEAMLAACGNGHLLPQGFTQADALMAVILSWAAPLQVDLSAYPHACALRDAVFARPAAQKARSEEGLD
ncbi:glutathione S-transferase N-terminal domain-containing protein [Komagataeibacter intermedius]|uniref:Glutathione S-transferase n=2 Tax=Komagataeibacter intermedius TaxID=66229 RepID=A0A0N1F9F3_9PROT|nr:glutathione binding-like protein [Komagataeibacter intermedius]KPH85767.1 glutathione S-transferase [Komagataeibacter intermedius AF2]MCF3637487.1 glutathione S-transferase N-terminal domain-containing protein [Komagataeibacter intermedius]GAN85573.1 glutathione S-transferase [Komagataeibacter intermedius TF2]GBQ77917.1 glutathione S-transferase [Komagataeibacter intermedius NRIC 0521]